MNDGKWKMNLFAGALIDNSMALVSSILWGKIHISDCKNLLCPCNMRTGFAGGSSNANKPTALITGEYSQWVLLSARHIPPPTASVYLVRVLWL